MKTGAVYVLVAFVAVGMRWPALEVRVPGICPKVPQGVFGSCVEMCSGDESCPQRMKCCSNGCGHICMYGVPQVSMNQSRAVQVDG
uniref:WAP domain-containing protein n=1 Tax=Felis catus TaxID=9685 RepID=A0ABI7XQK6_FELCA